MPGKISKGYRIIHIEDDPEFRDRVKESLAGILGVDLRQAEDLEAFYEKVSFDVDLYITDRHFPPKPGAKVADLWGSVVASASEMRNLYPNKGVMVLSDNPPTQNEWMRYSTNLLLNVLRKSDFDPESFRQMVEFYLREE